MAEQDAIFDKVMKSVGDNGFFQKRFNCIFNVTVILFSVMAYMNIILALSVPDHWCHVPGREETNFTVEQWKKHTLPMEIDTRGLPAVSSCHMYNITDWTTQAMVGLNKSTTAITTCQYGYEYDTTWYSRTAPSQEDWVCDKEFYVTNTLVFSRIGEVVGTFIFGQLGDAIGRRPVFYIGILATVVGRLIFTISAGWYSVLLFATVVGSLAATAMFQSPLIIAMEISSSEDRAHIALMQSVGWTLGMSLSPLVMWWARDWFVFMLVTSLPLLLAFCLNKYMVESPRWLAGRGKLAQSTAMLKKIAKVNGTRLNSDALALLKESSSAPDRVYGILSLFSSWRLAKMTMMVMMCWVVCALCYTTMLLNVSNMSGNPFLNFFYQAMAELPAYILARICTDRIGRRWTSCGAYMVAATTCLPLILVVNSDGLDWMCVILAVIIKFSISIAFYVITLQSTEVYPTCLRQTGISVGALSSSALAILAPFIVLLGTSFDARYPYVLISLMMLTGAMCTTQLPETLHHKLPETIADAHVFGQDQRFWSLPRKHSLTEDKIQEKIRA